MPTNSTSRVNDLVPSAQPKYDNSGKPFEADRYRVLAVNPDSSRMVEWSGSQVTQMTRDLAVELLRMRKSGEVVAPYTGLTSGVGMFRKPADLDGTITALKLPLINDPKILAPHAIFKRVNGVPGINIPGNATVPAALQLLDSAAYQQLQHDPNTQGYLHNDFKSMTISNGVGGGSSLVTGALGHNRLPIDVLEVELIVGGRVIQITDQREIDALRGTGGYAGLVSRLTIALTPKPKSTTTLALSLVGDTPFAALAETLPLVVSQLWAPISPYRPGDLRAMGIDVMDFEAVRLVAESADANGGADNAIRTAREWIKSDIVSPQRRAMLMMEIDNFGSYDWTEANPQFFERLCALEEQGIIRTLPLEGSKEHEAHELRAIAPRVARNVNPETHVSSSTDMDVRALYDGNGSLEDGVRTHTMNSMVNTVAMGAAVREAGGVSVVYGHVNAMGYPFAGLGKTRYSTYEVGGRDPHSRSIVPVEAEDDLKDIVSENGKAERKCHGRTVAGVTNSVRPGEKNNPHKKEDVQAAARNHKTETTAKLEAIGAAGKVHNGRAPESLRRLVARTVEPKTGELIILDTSRTRNGRGGAVRRSVHHKP